MNFPGVCSPDPEIFCNLPPPIGNVMLHAVSEKRKIYFSSWSRKGYAVFSALGKEVYIASLALHMCDVVLLKSAHHGVIVNEACACGYPVEEKPEKERKAVEIRSSEGLVCSGDKGKSFGLPAGERDMVPYGPYPFFYGNLM